MDKLFEQTPFKIGDRAVDCQLVELNSHKEVSLMRMIQTSNTNTVLFIGDECTQEIDDFYQMLAGKLNMVFIYQSVSDGWPTTTHSYEFEPLGDIPVLIDTNKNEFSQTYKIWPSGAMVINTAGTIENISDMENIDSLISHLLSKKHSVKSEVDDAFCLT